MKRFGVHYNLHPHPTPISLPNIDYVKKELKSVHILYSASKCLIIVAGQNGHEKIEKTLSTNS